MKLIPSSIVLACALVLTACGGGGGGSQAAADAPVQTSADADTVVPASATASVQSFAQYVGKLPVDDAREPLDAAAVMAPVSDTDEPVVL